MDNDDTSRVETDSNTDDSDDEIITDPQEVRDNNSRDSNDGPAEEDNLDEEIGLASENMPSSMGLTFLISKDIQKLTCQVEFATYRRAKVSDCRIPFSPKNAEGYVVPAVIEDYVYFDNSETKWQNVYAYWWNDDFHLITNKLTGEAYPANGENGTQVLDKSWPGVQMEKVGDTDIYRCVMPVEATKIIFNSGVPDEDIYAGKEGYQTGDTEFGNDYGGKIYTVDISVAAKAGRGVEKTKYKYNAGAWSDYTP